jgi:DNA modification methylase
MTITILQGNWIDRLRELPPESVHCVVTSPPYFGLRSYLDDDDPEKALELGSEKTPEEYVWKLVEGFREVRRVLRKDGTCWCNLGDSYAGDRQSHATTDSRRRDNERIPRSDRCINGLKPKDLIGIPWMVAFALRADGWFLRSDIIWHKPNPMPESAGDRPTKSHEYLFLLSRSRHYYYDKEAILEQTTGTAHPRVSGSAAAEIALARSLGGNTVESNQGLAGVNPKAREKQAGVSATSSMVRAAVLPVQNRNRRSVWSIPSAAYSGAHFATFPPDLVKPCILAGTSAGGCCPKCGSPYGRMIEEGAPNLAQQQSCGGDLNGEYHGQARKDYQGGKAQDASATKARILAGMVERVTVGWAPSCQCAAGDPISCTVLDPFGGSGTTGQVAAELARNAILIELNRKYIPLIRDRLNHTTPGLPLGI